jgi:hypothetical protein
MGSTLARALPKATSQIAKAHTIQAPGPSFLL